tara:strand:+ start:6083 stop:6535 length:453 start_codon:yes stop_codon:yes gene_type:complete
MKTKYLAYGSNLNKEQMMMRCPHAEPKNLIILQNFRLIFRGVADIIPASGFVVPVVEWLITEQCEKSLDIYEGFPNLYDKKYFCDNDGTSFMTYTMNGNGFQMPPLNYLKVIERGYDDFGIDKTYITEALEFTKANQDGLGYIPTRYKSA